MKGFRRFLLLARVFILGPMRNKLISRADSAMMALLRRCGFDLASDRPRFGGAFCVLSLHYPGASLGTPGTAFPAASKRLYWTLLSDPGGARSPTGGKE